MKKLLVISMLILAGCGKGAGSNSQPVTITPVADGSNYHLQGSITEPGDTLTDANVSVAGILTIPDHADALQNAAEAGYGTLKFTGGQCYYRNIAGSSVYTFTDCTGGYSVGQHVSTTTLSFGLSTGYYTQSAKVEITVFVK